MCTLYDFFSFLRGVELRYFSVQNALRGMVCVICNSKSFLSFLFKLCILIVHILKMCTFYYVSHFTKKFSFLRGVELRYFSVQKA